MAKELGKKEVPQAITKEYLESVGIQIMSKEDKLSYGYCVGFDYIGTCDSCDQKNRQLKAPFYEEHMCWKCYNSRYKVNSSFTYDMDKQTRESAEELVEKWKEQGRK